MLHNLSHLMSFGDKLFQRLAAFKQHPAASLANAEMNPATIDPNTFFTAKYGIVGFRDQVLYS